MSGLIEFEVRRAMQLLSKNGYVNIKGHDVWMDTVVADKGTSTRPLHVFLSLRGFEVHAHGKYNTDTEFCRLGYIKTPQQKQQDEQRRKQQQMSGMGEMQVEGFTHSHTDREDYWKGYPRVPLRLLPPPDTGPKESEPCKDVEVRLQNLNRYKRRSERICLEETKPGP